MRVDEYTKGLRELAGFIDEHIPAHELDYGIQINLFADTAESLLKKARSLGGAWKKEDKGQWFTLRRDFGPHHVDINIYRDEVCERVQVGTETIEVPDPAAPKVTVEQPIYEWRCPESLNQVA